MAIDKATESFVQPTIQRFDGHYNHRSMLMENFLRSKKYWNLVESGIDTPAKGALDRSILETILENETSKQIWVSLKKKYKGPESVKPSKIRSNGGTMEEVKVMEKIVRSSTPTFNYIVCSIEEVKDVAKLRVDELQSSLLVHEQRLNRTTASEEQIALKASTFSESSSSLGGIRYGRSGKGGRGHRGGGRSGHRDDSKSPCVFKRDDDFEEK
ncbi:hypothetical protein ACFX13_027213 [Malus domestica]